MLLFVLYACFRLLIDCALAPLRDRALERQVKVVHRWKSDRLVLAAPAAGCQSPAGPHCVVLGTVGLRIGEALGLRWEDVDLVSGRLQFRRALQRQRARCLVFVEPKSVSSRRCILPFLGDSERIAPAEAAHLLRPGLSQLSG